MKKPRSVSLAVAFIVTTFTQTAAAYEPPQLDRSVDVQLFEPAFGSTDYLTVTGGGILPHLEFAVGLVFNYQREPLNAFRVKGTELQEPASSHIVSGQLSSNLVASMGLFGHFQVGIGIPLTLYQTGEGVDGHGQPGGSIDQAGVMGDLRLQLCARLYQGEEGIRIAFAPVITFPSGDDGRYFGEKSVTFRPTFALEYRLRELAMALNLGYLLRKNAAIFASEVGDELLYSGALAYRLSPHLDLIGELAGRNGFSLDLDENPLELRAGAHINLTSNIAISLGAGAGLVKGIGSPDYRVFLGVVWDQSRAE